MDNCFKFNLTFIDWKIKSKIWLKKSNVAVLQNAGQTSLGVLCAVLVTTLSEKCGCVGESAEETHQDIT